MLNALIYLISHRVEAVPILTVPSIIVVRLVPRSQRAAGATVYSSACREPLLRLMPSSAQIGFTTRVTLLVVLITVLTKYR